MPDPEYAPPDPERAVPLIAAAERERAEVAEARLDEIRRATAAFLGHHGNSAAFALQSARDLAEGIRQILDRTALEPEDGKEPRP